MSFKKFVKDSLVGIFVMVLGVFIIISNPFFKLSLSQEMEIILALVGVLLLVFGVLFVSYTLKKSEIKQDY